MAATAAQIAKVRRMAAEPTTTPYSDADIKAYIEAYPLVDDVGRKPWTATVLAANGLTETPATAWTPTYDLNAAAADIWAEKAAGFVANGQVYETDSVYRQAQRQVRYYRSRRSVRMIELSPDVPVSALDPLNPYG